MRRRMIAWSVPDVLRRGRRGDLRQNVSSCFDTIRRRLLTKHHASRAKSMPHSVCRIVVNILKDGLIFGQAL